MAESQYTAPATYTITFPSLSQAEVKVSVNGAELSTSNYSISGYATSGSGTVTISSTVNNGDIVRIYRDTDVSSPEATFAPGASIKANDLNENNKQLRYKAEEKVNSGDIASRAVTTDALRDLSVTNVKIAEGAITTNKINATTLVDTSEYASNWASDDTKIATVGSISARHDVVVGTSVPSTNQPGKQFLDTSPNNLNFQVFDGSNWRIVFPNIPATTTSVRYVDAFNGSDAADVTGHSPLKPLLTIKRAVELTNAASDGDGTLINVAAGVYQEALPIRITKKNVSIVGTSMRSCFVHPTTATETSDMFEVDSGTYLSNLTLVGLKVPTNDQGSRNNSIDNDATHGLPSNQPFAVRFRTDSQPTILISPYIQNCTILSDAQFDNANFDPDTFPSTDSETYSVLAGDETSAPCGGGFFVDGGAVTAGSAIRSMIIDSVDQISLDGPGILVTNHGYAQVSNYTGSFNHYQAKAKNGGQVSLTGSQTEFGRYGLLADGKSSAAIATATASAANSGSTQITIGAITTAQSFYGTVSQPAAGMILTVDNTDYTVSSSSANGQGWDVTLTSALTSNISNTTVSFALRSFVRANSHSFYYVGVGTNYSNHPDKGGIALPNNKFKNLNGGAVYHVSTDETENLSVSGTVDGRDLAADGTKLDGIEAGATADQTAAEIRALVEAATDSNVFTDTDHTKLNGIAAGAEVNVQADWTATSGDALILNKPTIPAAYTDTDVDTHLNQSTAQNGEVLSWNGTDYDWIVQGSSSYGNTNVDTHLNKGSASSGEVLSWTGTDYDWVAQTAAYTDTSVDTHLNKGSASSGEVLSWTGTDYDWVAQTAAYSNTNVDSHLNNSNVTSGHVLSWNGSDYAWVAQSTPGIGSLVVDTSPQLGGDLDVNGNDIVSASNNDIDLDPDGTGVVTFKGNANRGSGQIKLNCEQNSHGITIKGPAHAAAANYTLTLPTTDGNANQLLKTDGSGNLDWADAGGGALTHISSINILPTAPFFSILEFDLAHDYDHFVILGSEIKFGAAQSSGYSSALDFSFYDGTYTSSSPFTNKLNIRYQNLKFIESSYSVSHSWASDLSATTDWSAGNPTTTKMSLKAEIGGKSNSGINIEVMFTDGSTRGSVNMIKAGDASNTSSMNTMLIKAGQSAVFNSGKFRLYGIKRT